YIKEAAKVKAGVQYIDLRYLEKYSDEEIKKCVTQLKAGLGNKAINEIVFLTGWSKFKNPATKGTDVVLDDMKKQISTLHSQLSGEMPKDKKISIAMCYGKDSFKNRFEGLSGFTTVPLIRDWFLEEQIGKLKTFLQQQTIFGKQSEEIDILYAGSIETQADNEYLKEYMLTEDLDGVVLFDNKRKMSVDRFIDFLLGSQEVMEYGQGLSIRHLHIVEPKFNPIELAFKLHQAKLDPLKVSAVIVSQGPERNLYAQSFSLLAQYDELVKSSSAGDAIEKKWDDIPVRIAAQAVGDRVGDASIKAVVNSCAEVVYIGHFEKRAAGETVEQRKEQFRLALNNDAIKEIVLFVGKPNGVFSNLDLEKNMLLEQIYADLEPFAKQIIEKGKKITFAYQPSRFVVEQGKIGNSAYIKHMIGISKFLKGHWQSMCGCGIGEFDAYKKARFLAVGGINENNIESFMQETYIEGVVLGNAGLELEKLLQLIEKTKESCHGFHKWIHVDHKTKTPQYTSDEFAEALCKIDYDEECEIVVAPNTAAMPFYPMALNKAAAAKASSSGQDLTELQKVFYNDFLIQLGDLRPNDQDIAKLIAEFKTHLKWKLNMLKQQYVMTNTDDIYYGVRPAFYKKPKPVITISFLEAGLTENFESNFEELVLEILHIKGIDFAVIVPLEFLEQSSRILSVNIEEGYLDKGHIKLGLKVHDGIDYDIEMIEENKRSFKDVDIEYLVLGHSSDLRNGQEKKYSYKGSFKEKFGLNKVAENINICLEKGLTPIACYDTGFVQIESKIDDYVTQESIIAMLPTDLCGEELSRIVFAYEEPGSVFDLNLANKNLALSRDALARKLNLSTEQASNIRMQCISGDAQAKDILEGVKGKRYIDGFFVSPKDINALRNFYRNVLPEIGVKITPSDTICADVNKCRKAMVQQYAEYLKSKEKDAAISGDIKNPLEMMCDIRLLVLLESIFLLKESVDNSANKSSSTALVQTGVKAVDDFNTLKKSMLPKAGGVIRAREFTPESIDSTLKVLRPIIKGVYGGPEEQRFEGLSQLMLDQEFKYWKQAVNANYFAGQMQKGFKLVQHFVASSDQLKYLNPEAEEKTLRGMILSGLSENVINSNMFQDELRSIRKKLGIEVVVAGSKPEEAVRKLLEKGVKKENIVVYFNKDECEVNYLNAGIKMSNVVPMEFVNNKDYLPVFGLALLARVKLLAVEVGALDRGKYINALQVIWKALTGQNLCGVDADSLVVDPLSCSCLVLKFLPAPETVVDGYQKELHMIMAKAICA
ncbi:MAG: triose-phosphate isomerase, partial [Candidatus Omnitrophota bacterium]